MLALQGSIRQEHTFEVHLRMCVLPTMLKGLKHSALSAQARNQVYSSQGSLLANCLL